LGVNVVPEVTPLAPKPVPETVTLEMLTFEFPVLVRLALSDALLPTFTLPKLRLVGFAVSRKVAAFTVSVAALLVTLPAELLTTTVNCAPLSAVVVTGVV
jgi:hypothetical protein